MDGHHLVAREHLGTSSITSEISQRLAHAEGLTDESAHALAREGKAVVWIDGGLHATETVGSQQEIEIVYQMLSRTDPETMRFLNDDILLCVPANPDGQELVANWYMREKDEKKRTLNGLPRLYEKYIGHDNNRDSLTSNMAETTNMNRQLFIEWNPQIMYNHHQSGPAGEVVFIPPMRDPVNHNLDALVTLGIQAVGTAMHERLVAQGKGGSGMRTQANYDGWWDGGIRNTCTITTPFRLSRRSSAAPRRCRFLWCRASSSTSAICRCPSLRRRGITASRSITRWKTIARCSIMRRGIARTCSTTSIAWG